MKRIVAVLSVITVILFSLSVNAFNASQVEAVTLGQGLTQPEAGWKRYDDTDPFIKYEGTWLTKSNGIFYNNTLHYAKTNGAKISFKFKGTKIRLIGHLYNNRSKNISIKIDDTVETFSQYGSLTSMSLDYEKLGLTEDIHTVEIALNDSGIYLIDAIDIDDSGELLNPDGKIVESLKLNKELLDLTVGSSESLIAIMTPEDAMNKIISWTSSDPEIASVDSNGNVIAKKAGNVTITAATTDGSNLLATSEVTVKEGEVDTNRAVLKLITTTGDLHEYDLSIKEIDKFINWLDGRDIGQGKPYYKFQLNTTTGNINARTEYIMYDEIVSFVVDEYN